MTNTKFDIAIIGAGIVGLATAMELVQRRPDLKLIVLEKESKVAAHQTGNNSGVIHAGLYYKPGSLKAKMVVEGARRMVKFCQEHNLPYELCGKVVVATYEKELPGLEELHRRGNANGVQGLTMINGEQIKDYEPHASGIAGLWSPNTGIVDYIAVTRKYAELVEQGGGEIQLDTNVLGIQQTPDGLLMQSNGPEVHARTLINCGGLQSDLIAKMTGNTHGLRIIPFRGEYYKLSPESQKLVRGLIYPVPDPRFPFLGVHFTKKIDGSIEAGPNAVLAFAREGYKKSDFSPGHVLGLLTYSGFWVMGAKYWRMGFGEMYRSWNKRAFVEALRVLLPDLGMDDVRPGGAGVRAQALDRSGKLLDDFAIIDAPNAIHVLNAPSPAATASIVIGEVIVDKALATFEM
ncbi:MAG TPA: L-2-hydroxyglutarate oxidase [Anaerolineae bacterium]|nr:L-2-hydroxyglutarate oxidase [Anaerolineae bacterium]